MLGAERVSGDEGHLGGGDLDALLGLGVAADALGAALHLKGTEAHQLNLVALGQAVGNDLNGRVDGGLGILLGQAGLLGGRIDQFSLIHIDNSSCVYWGNHPSLIILKANPPLSLFCVLP